MSDLHCGCCFAELALCRAELCRSVHSVLRCASTARTSPNSVAPHPRRAPRAASSDLTRVLCPSRTKTAPAPKCKIQRACLQEHRPSLHSARNSSVLTEVGSKYTPPPRRLISECILNNGPSTAAPDWSGPEYPAI